MISWAKILLCLEGGWLDGCIITVEISFAIIFPVFGLKNYLWFKAIRHAFWGPSALVLLGNHSYHLASSFTRSACKAYAAWAIISYMLSSSSLLVFSCLFSSENSVIGLALLNLNLTQLESLPSFVVLSCPCC